MQQLRYFIEVLEQGSFSRAAEELGRSQQAVSRAIRTLEENVGVRLLDRGTGRVRPTAFGEALAVHARGILGHDRAFRDELRHSLGSQRGSVRLGAGPVVAQIAYDAVRAARMAQPNLHVIVLSGIRRTFESMLIEKSIDLAICVDNYPPRDATPGVTKEVLTHTTYAVLAGDTHPLARATRVDTTTLRDQQWVFGITTGEMALAWREIFVANGISPPVPAVETDSVEFCRAALLSGEWLTVLPCALFERELGSGQIVAIDAPGFLWQRPIVMIYRSTKSQDGCVLTLMNLIHQTARQHRQERGASGHAPR